MHTNPQQLLILEELAIRSGLNQPWLRNALESLQVRWNKRLYATIFNYILANLNPDCELSMAFNLPRDQLEITGEINLGHINGSPDIRFCVPLAKLPVHVFAAGSSGSGKTIFALRLIEEAHMAGVERIRIVDPKADEYFTLAHKYPDFLLLKWNDLRFNPLIPPPNVPLNEWHQSLVGHLAQTFNFWQGGEALFIRCLANSIPNNPDFTFSNLLKATYQKVGPYSQKDSFVISTISSRIQMLLNLFGDSITTNSDMLERLSEMKVIISTTGLMAESESWFVEFLLLWEYMYRVYNPAKRELTLHVYDECQHRLFSNKKDRDLHHPGSSFISQLVDQARALKIAICSLSQEPSTLIKAVVNNSYLKVAFHLGSGGEVRVMKEAMGLDDEQASILHYLETGEAIVRTAGCYMEPIPVVIDNFTNPNEIREYDFQEHQREMKNHLYQISFPSHGQLTCLLPDQQTDSPQRLPGHHPHSVNLPVPAHSSSHSTNTSDQPLSKFMPILQVWLNLKTPFLTQGALFQKAGITSGSAQAKIKKALLRHGVIIEHKLQVGKTYSSVWEPTHKAYELTGISKPRFQSKGGYLHQFISYHVSQWGANKGYAVEVESFLSNGKAVDLLLRRNNEVTFVEIAISEPLEKEITNIIKDFDTDSTPDHLIIVVKDGKLKKRMKQLINSDDGLKNIRDLVEVNMACSFMNQD